MMTVKQVSKLTGVSIRTLQYYDKIGLFRPTEYTDSGYRLYDGEALEKLQQILLFKELEFSLADIKAIISSPDFDRSKAIEQQITMLTLKKEHLENLIAMACGIITRGEKTMDFSAFDTKKLDEYAKQAKEQWGGTYAYKEFSEKSKNRSSDREKAIGLGLMTIFKEFGGIKDSSPESEDAAKLVEKLQSYITENYYTCTRKIMLSLAEMYSAGGEFTENIDKSGGKGTASFAADAIKTYFR